MKIKLQLIVISLAFFGLKLVFAQDEFNVDAYNSFLEQNKNLSAQEILQMYPAGNFSAEVKTAAVPEYFDSVKQKYNLTGDEISLLNKHGFTVTERLSQPAFGFHYKDIFHKDLPLFISTDAILHAFHASYDAVLKEIELNYLIDEIYTFLDNLHAQLPELDEKYSSNPEMITPLKDADFYLTMARKLLKPGAEPYYNDMGTEYFKMLQKIESEDARSVQLFSEKEREVDFSQFKPRGHYVDEYFPELAQYFKAMIWLGRIEIYLISPKALGTQLTKEEIKRQIILSVLLDELIEKAGEKERYDKIEEVLAFFVGKPDNVVVDNLRLIKDKINLNDASELLDTIRVEEFQNALAEKSWAHQRILSQILYHDPSTPDKIEPASAFLMFGQRFIVDSYITANVVYDKVQTPRKRMLPSILDILYALGNNASLQLLKEEIETFKYAPQLAGLRYLINGYDEDFWYETIYNSWLQMIRTLNPPAERETLPEFMKTAAFWQQKMNTQLSSWTELRHDNLLYAKQSYSGGIICSFPYIYVEPIPEFYNALSKASGLIADKFSATEFLSDYRHSDVDVHFNYFKKIADTLKIVAEKELNGETLSNSEKKFLTNFLTLNTSQVCGAPEYNGWYPDLYYGAETLEDGFFKEDFLTADYHTAPTDENGMDVGWVKHAGTGQINMMFVNAETPDGNLVTFSGPVMSFHEFTTTNFLRLNDDEWKETYLAQSTRPEWTKLYLADESGAAQSGAISLVTNVEENLVGESLPVNYLTAKNYPNPFNPETIISFSIPQSLTNEKVELVVYNLNGEIVKRLVNENLPSGNYLTKWNGTNNFGKEVASGVYIYRLKAGTKNFAGKMNLIK